ncbi:hypothetical protein B0T25DRAFT_290388 [Lasiosphaeria hispida]|uniref:Uncharacterized protein n=1 Tax=Lasiosphaeria hispida TaxID=260671 RepID=A0AAJ0HC56_9PEZI|nr:hypothetical protein B0T25DRAFT_290388 [Lasiosphaeria hispida]
MHLQQNIRVSLVEKMEHDITAIHCNSPSSLQMAVNDFANGMEAVNLCSFPRLSSLCSRQRRPPFGRFGLGLVSDSARYSVRAVAVPYSHGYALIIAGNAAGCLRIRTKLDLLVAFLQLNCSLHPQQHDMSTSLPSGLPCLLVCLSPNPSLAVPPSPSTRFLASLESSTSPSTPPPSLSPSPTRHHSRHLRHAAQKKGKAQGKLKKRVPWGQSPRPPHTNSHPLDYRLVSLCLPSGGRGGPHRTHPPSLRLPATIPSLAF